MNTKQRLLTAFLGGLVGILLSGYAYYFTQEQHYWLLPIGVFLGSAVGYCFANAKTFFQNTASQLMKRKSVTALAFYHRKKKTLSALAVCKAACKKWFKKIGPAFVTAWRWSANGFARLIRSAMTMHPVTRALVIRTITSLAFFGIAGYLWVMKVIPSNIIHELFGHTKHDGGLASVLVVFSLLSLVCCTLVSIVMNISNTFEDQSSFFLEYEKYNNKFTMTIKNLISDLAMFITSQLMAVGLFAVLMFAMGYIIVFGMITMMCLMFLLCSIEYAKAMKKHNVFVTFITTLVITSICYFVFKSFFANQLFIWIAALCSGSVCGLACHSFEGYLARFASSAIVDDEGHDFLDKVLNATFGYIPKKLWQWASPLTEKAADFIGNKQRLLARW